MKHIQESIKKLIRNLCAPKTLIITDDPNFFLDVKEAPSTTIVSLRRDVTTVLLERGMVVKGIAEHAGLSFSTYEELLQHYRRALPAYLKKDFYSPSARFLFETLTENILCDVSPYLYLRGVLWQLIEREAPTRVRFRIVDREQKHFLESLCRKAR